MPPSNHAVMLELLREVSEGLGQKVAGVLQDYRFPPPVLLLMREVHLCPGTTVSELSRTTGFAKSYVSNRVDDLCRQGLVEKRTDPRDHRMLRLYVTEEACRLREEIGERLKSLISSIVVDVPDDKVDGLIAGLLEIKQALHAFERRQTGNQGSEEETHAHRRAR